MRLCDFLRRHLGGDGVANAHIAVASLTFRICHCENQPFLRGDRIFANAQPPTYTIVDANTPPASTGARQYAYAVPTELTLSGMSTGLVEWEAKYTAIASAITGAAPTNTLSTVAPQPSWNTTVTIGATPEYNNVEYKVTLMRKAEPIFGNNAQQAPFAIPRGWFNAELAMNFDPADDRAVNLRYVPA